MRTLFPILFIVLLALALPVQARQFKKCNQEEKKCLRNPLRKMTGECKKNRKRCERGEAKKLAQHKAKMNQPLPIRSVRGDLLLNSALEDLVGQQRLRGWRIAAKQKSLRIHGGRANAHTGAKAIQLRHGSGSFSQVVPLRGEGTSKGLYKLTYYLKGEGNPVLSRLSVLNESISRADRTVAKVAVHTKPSANWVKHEKIITIEDEAFATEVKFSWNVRARNGGKSGSIWIDDISLIKQ